MPLEIDRLFETDVLVVGGGAAASRTAVAAAEQGARVLVVLKKRWGESGATNYPRKGLYGSAWQTADGCGPADDSPAVHYEDIMTAAAGMADARMAWLLAHESRDRLRELDEWGFKLIPDPAGRQRHYVGYSCFATQPRAHGMFADPVGGHTGNMVQVLANRYFALGGEVHENVQILDVLVEHGACVGAVGMHRDGGLVGYSAGAVVLATGGASQMFPISHTPGDITGDGYAIALRAGAELVNLEFMQYMTRPIQGEPPKTGGPFWSLAPRLKGPNGQDLLAEVIPSGVVQQRAFDERTLHYPFSSGDESKWIDIAIQSAIRSGLGTPRGGVLVDFSGVDLRKAKPPRPQHHPGVASLELGDDVIELTHSAHAINGGIRIDEFGESSIPGLFAVGETIAGPHGADRLGGGMLAACNVFGTRAGGRAAERSRSVQREVSRNAYGNLSKRLGSFASGSSADWQAIRGELKSASAAALLVIRDHAGLGAFLGTVVGLRERLKATGLGDAPVSALRVLETENLLLVAEVMGRAALLRRESRGSHFRTDFTRLDDTRWNRSIFWRLDESGLLCGLGRFRQDPNLNIQVEEGIAWGS